MEKVIVAFEKEKNALYIRDLIESSGLAAVQLCRSGMEVRRLAGQGDEVCVVCGYKLLDGSAEALFDDLPHGSAMLMIATQPQLDLCVSEGIFQLPAPARREELLEAVALMLTTKGRGSDGEVRRAKAILMARRGMSEAEAHRYLQRKSMDKGCKLVDVARAFLEAERG